MSGEQLTRGDLPHWYQPGYAHFITYRLAGTIPVEWLRERRAARTAALNSRPADVPMARHRANVHKRFFAEYDAQLDRASGRRWLADERVAAMVRENLYHHDGAKYSLLAWCVMPNHVHVLLQPFEATVLATLAGTPDDSVLSDELCDSKSPLSRIMHSLKSYTANRANQLLGQDGSFWQKESYDHWVRDLDELERIVAYIINNPVAAGMCEHPRDWRFSSAFDRFALDGSDCGMVGTLRDDWRR